MQTDLTDGNLKVLNSQFDVIPHTELVLGFGY